ncbi:MAG: FAD-linked oxidase C-terminal domain-containing protein [Candidatus Krumholzibacteriota bacterium]|nr:FAD-linked oxidase C-terminal domain-containing protein [Candidatus Krumholzibacteriota bacterium]
MADQFPRRINELKNRIGDVILRTENYFRVAYGYDATGIRGFCGGVAFPESEHDLALIVKNAAMLEIPLIPRGAGTGFSGGSVPVEGSVVVSTEKMRRVLSYKREMDEVEVQSGIVNGKLQEYLEPLGFFYPPDPASYKVSTIGGNIAENAGGPRAYKYGVTRRYVMSLKWITPDGRILEGETRGPASLLIGSEGTLGIIYSARLKVFPIPKIRKTFLLGGGGDGDAMITASNLLRSGFRPSVLEFIDSKTMRCVAEYLGILPVIEERGDLSYLFLEVEGTEIQTADQQRLLKNFCNSKGFSLITAENYKERELLWDLRRSISASLARRGITKINEDIALPLGKLSESVTEIHKLASEKKLDCYIFGHCGDGNLHVNIMTDRRKKMEMVRAGEFVHDLFSYVIAAGGTLSGEHGIGSTKRPYLDLAFSETELRLQNAVKNVMDPGSGMNPGKYFDKIVCGGG